jgi:hypothetical protein
MYSLSAEARMAAALWVAGPPACFTGRRGGAGSNIG